MQRAPAISCFRFPYYYSWLERVSEPPESRSSTTKSSATKMAVFIYFYWRRDAIVVLPFTSAT
jgi:hypothetical protein